MVAKHSDYVTKTELKDELDYFGKRIVDELSEVINAMGFRMHEELVEVNSRMDDVKSSLNKLTNTVDGFAKRYEEQRVEIAARDFQISRHERWLRKLR